MTDYPMQQEAARDSLGMLLRHAVHRDDNKVTAGKPRLAVATNPHHQSLSHKRNGNSMPWPRTPQARTCPYLPPSLACLVRLHFSLGSSKFTIGGGGGPAPLKSLTPTQLEIDAEHEDDNKDEKVTETICRPKTRAKSGTTYPSYSLERADAKVVDFGRRTHGVRNTGLQRQPAKSCLCQ